MSEDAPQTARHAVVATALDLFATQGFEATSVEQIAQAAGISRSTFFRQFGGKDDVVFADHEIVLDELRAHFAQTHDNPWAAVCESSLMVYRHFAVDPELARRRYTVVRAVPALRDREIVTVFRYERLFHDYLRKALPSVDPAHSIAFAASVAAVHNHVFRQQLRGPRRVPISVLESALDDLKRRFGVHEKPTPPADDDVIVAVFPRRMPPAEVARRLADKLD